MGVHESAEEILAFADLYHHGFVWWFDCTLKRISRCTVYLHSILGSMQFLIIAHDGTDEDALNRRKAERGNHIALSDEAIKRGEQIVGAAILGEDGDMKGSAMIVDFPSRTELDAWLEKEPYVTGNVWQDIKVYPCKIGPSFQHAIPKTS